MGERGHDPEGATRKRREQRSRLHVLVSLAASILVGQATGAPHAREHAEGEPTTAGVDTTAVADTTAAGPVEVVVVSGERRDEVAISEQLVDVDIKRRAAVIATDPLRVMQLLPGVALGADDFSNRMAVRGGDPEENVFLFDGYRLLQPNHLEGFTSIVYDDLVGRMDFYPAAYPLRYGEALSSVTDIVPRVPAPAGGFFRYDVGSMALGGEVSAGSFGLTGAARTSFYDLVFGRPPSVDESEFQDVTISATAATRLGPLSACVVASRDRERGDVDRNANGWLVGARLGRRAGNAALSLSAAGQRGSETNGDFGTARADLQRATLTGHRELALGEALSIRGDAEVRRERFDGGRGTKSDATSAVAVTAMSRFGPLDVQAGVRSERIAFTRGRHGSPYLSSRVRLASRVRLTTSWRRAHQMPFSGEAVQSIGGLRLHAAELFEVAGDRLDPIRADLVSAELELRLDDGVTLGAVAYEKAYDRFVTWRDPGGPTAEAIENGGEGVARGVDVSLRRRGSSGVTGEVTWSRSFAERREGAFGRRRADFDRPHTLLASVVVPLGERTTLGITYRRADGRPFAEQELTPEGVPIVTALNASRLPAYRRLDLRLQFEAPMTVGDLFFYLDVLNVRNRENIVDFFYVLDDGRLISNLEGGVSIAPIAGAGFYF